MRLLHVHCRYRDRGGEDAVVDAERELLSRAGIDVIPYDAANPSNPGLSAGRLLLSPWNPAAYARLRRLIQRTRTDIAHVHNTWYSLSPSILEALQQAQVPVVMTVHNFRLACVNGLLFRDGQPCTDCVGRGSWSGVVHRCYRSSMLASAAVAATNTANRALGTWARGVDRFLVLNSLAADVLQRTGIAAQRIRLTSNFVSDPGRRQRGPSSSTTIVYVGRLAPEKGIELLLRAWRDFQPSQPWTLAIAGDGHLRAQLPSLADDRVRFLGRRSAAEIRDLMLNARALVLPSLVFENQPMAAIEAFAAGLPVLGRRLGGTLEVVRPLGERWMVDHDRPDHWTAALRRLIDDEAVDEAGRTARDTYELRYTAAAATTRLLSLYEELAPPAERSA